MFTLRSRKCHCVHMCDTVGLSSLCIATVFVPKVESAEWADVPKVKLGEQRVKWQEVEHVILIHLNLTSSLKKTASFSSNLMFLRYLNSYLKYKKGSQLSIVILKFFSCVSSLGIPPSLQGAAPSSSWSFWPGRVVLIGESPAGTDHQQM